MNTHPGPPEGREEEATLPLLWNTHPDPPKGRGKRGWDIV